MEPKENKVGASIILELLGLFLSFVALLVSLQANVLSKSNEAKLLRLECIDKADESSRLVLYNYRKIIPLMSSIYNNKDYLGSISKIHSEFQETGQSLIDSIDKFEKIIKRYEAACPESVSNSVSKARIAGLQSYDGELKDLEAFTPEVMQTHRDNLGLMFKEGSFEHCCPKGSISWF